MANAVFQSFDESADPTQGPPRLKALRAELGGEAAEQVRVMLERMGASVANAAGVALA